MIELHFTTHDLAVGALSAGSWLAIGIVIGVFYFLTLRWNVRMLTAGRPRLSTMATQAGRFAAVGIVLAFIAGYFGALALLATTAGILAARTAIIRFGAQP